MVTLIVHLTHLNSIDHHAEDTKFMTSTDVTAQTDFDVFVEKGTHRSHTR